MVAVNTFGASGLLSRHTSAGSVFYTFDERGNVAQRTGSTGAALSSDLYDGFGKLLSGGAAGDPWGFGAREGYYTDGETGLLLTTFRYYDPSTGRFLTRDPMGYAGGVNLYGYTANNPINGIDPSGLSQDVGGSNSTVRLSFTAFIPTSTTLGGYGGDNRGFSANSSQYRLEQNIVVNLGLGIVHILPGRVGASHHGPISDTASNDGMTGIYKREKCGNYNITIDGDVSNPLFRDEFGISAPGIRYHVNIVVDPQGHVVNWSGTHSGFPAFELYSYQNGMAPDRDFSYMPSGSPLDLFRTTPFSHNP